MFRANYFKYSLQGNLKYLPNLLGHILLDHSLESESMALLLPGYDEETHKHQHM